MDRALKRWGPPAAAAAAAVVGVRWYGRAQPVLPDLDYLTGWALLALIVLLTVYNLRKKLSFLPLLSSRAWLLAHSWLGVAAAAVFVAHTRARVPSGALEATLAALFVLVTLSGLAGLWLSRILPRRLAAAGGEVPFEQIPVIRRALREKAEALVVAGVPTSSSSTLADFYAARMSAFFAAPANLGAHLFGYARTLSSILTELGEVKRYLNPAERSAAVELAALAREKDALDVHRSIQLVLKGWLFVHIPLTYGMLVFIAAHVIVVYAYSGGAR